MTNISRSKGNQTIKFGQLIEYDMKKKKKKRKKSHTQNAVEVLFPDPLLKNQSWPELWINSQKFYTACFYCMPGWGLSKYIKLSCLLLPHVKLLEKIKGGLELVSLSHFRNQFWRKICLFLYSITWPNLVVWLNLLCEILGNISIVIVY